MTELLKLFFKISLLKANPQDVPPSSFLMMLSIAVYGLLSLIISTIELPIAKAIFSALIDTGLLFALASVSLWIIGASERKAQTVTALAGTGSIVQIIAMPIMLWLSQIGEADASLLFLPRWALLLLVIWNITIIAHILRHALSLAFPIAIGIAVLYVYFTIRVASILFIAAG